MPAIPGMGGLGAAGRAGTGKKQKKGKKGQGRRSGNPAKRALQESGAAPDGTEEVAAETLSELPSEFTDLLGR